MKVGIISLKNKLLEKEVFHKNVSDVIKALHHFYKDPEIICDASPQAIYVLDIFMQAGLKSSTIYFPCGYSSFTGINSCWEEPNSSGHFSENSNASKLRFLYKEFEKKMGFDEGFIEKLVSNCTSFGSGYKEIWSGDTLSSICEENPNMLIAL